MHIRKTFEQWLQQFNQKLKVKKINTQYVNKETDEATTQENPDVAVIYYGKKRICSIPKELISGDWTSKVTTLRKQGSFTSDGIAHRTLPGIGIALLKKNLITPQQFSQHFIDGETKYIVDKLMEKGLLKKNPFL